MARSIPPRMHWRRWLKLHSRSPSADQPIATPIQAGEINYDSYPPQVNDKLPTDQPLPLRDVFPKKPGDV